MHWISKGFIWENKVLKDKNFKQFYLYNAIKMFTKSFITSVHFKKWGKRVGVLNIEFAPFVNQISINIQ